MCCLWLYRSQLTVKRGADGCWKEVYNPQSRLCACCANAHISLLGRGGVECKEITQESA